MSDVKDFLYLPDSGAYNTFDTIKGGQFDGKEPFNLINKLIKDSNEPAFHIHDFRNAPAKATQCGLCGGTHFHVGTAAYYTAIKCVKCEWELCIHEG